MAAPASGACGGKCVPNIILNLTGLFLGVLMMVAGVTMSASRRPVRGEAGARGGGVGRSAEIIERPRE